METKSLYPAELVLLIIGLIAGLYVLAILVSPPHPADTAAAVRVSTPKPVRLPPLVAAPVHLPFLIRTAEPPRYHITALPADFVVSGLNNKGELVGTSEPAKIQIGAVVWARGKYRSLPTVDSFSEHKGLCITDASLVGGTASRASSGAYTFFEETVVLWDARAKKPVPHDVGSGSLSVATLSALNARGQAVGWSSPGSMFEVEGAGTENENKMPRAFFWDGRNFLDLGSGYACGINARGQVVGAQNGKIVLWQESERRILCDGDGYAINNRGQIVGISDFGRRFKVSYMAPGQRGIDNPNPPNERKTFYYPLTHALLYDKEKPQDLGVLPGQYFSRATALNDRGQVVGVCTRQNDYQFDFDKRQNRAFLWQAGRMIALNALLPKNSGWNLFDVKAINNRGQIVGIGALHGKERSYLLTPQ